MLTQHTSNAFVSNISFETIESRPLTYLQIVKKKRNKKIITLTVSVTKFCAVKLWF